MSKKNEDAAVAAPTDTAAPLVPGTERLTPAEWAERKGLIGKVDPAHPWRAVKVDPIYAAANVLHGWAADAHDYQADADRQRLLDVDFDKALEAAAAYPAKPAHEPACGRQFKDRAKPVVDPHTKAVLGTGKTVHATKDAVKTNG